jgi:hypothetical protein
MSKKTSAQLDRDIQEARAKAERSRRLGRRSAQTAIASTNFNFQQISDTGARHAHLREDRQLFGVSAIDDDAWRQGWDEEIARERRDYDLNRPDQAFIPLDLGFFHKR